MNRRKKVKETLKKKAKKANIKKDLALNPSKKKPRYISKAERAKMEAEQSSAEALTQTNTDGSETGTTTEQNS